MIGKFPFVLHSQYNGGWWPGDARIQNITDHEIDVILPEYSVLTPEGSNFVTWANIGILTVFDISNSKPKHILNIPFSILSTFHSEAHFTRMDGPKDG